MDKQISQQTESWKNETNSVFLSLPKFSLISIVFLTAFFEIRLFEAEHLAQIERH